MRFNTSAELLAAADNWPNIVRVLLDRDNRVIDVLSGREYLPGDAVRKVIDPVVGNSTRIEALEFRGDDVDNPSNWRKVACPIWIREVIHGLVNQSVIEAFVIGDQFEML